MVGEGSKYGSDFVDYTQLQKPKDKKQRTLK